MNITEAPAVKVPFKAAVKDLSKLFDRRVFVREMLGIELLPFQEAPFIYNKDNKVSAVCCGRKIGKTKVMAKAGMVYDAFMLPYKLMVEHNLDKPVAHPILCLGHNKENAKELSANIRDAINSNPILAEEVDSKSETYLRTITGTEVFTRTVGNNAAQIRGYGGEYIFDYVSRKGITVGMIIYADEVAYFRDKNALNSVIEPMLSIGDDSRLYAFTTPNGRSGEFFDMWQSRGWKKFRFSTLYNLDEHGGYISKKWLSKVREELLSTGRENIWLQEYMGQFVECAGVYFPWAIWVQSIDDEVDLWEDDYINGLRDKVSGDFCMGIDPNSLTEGYMNDYIAISITERIGKRIIQRYRKRWKDSPVRNLSMTDWAVKHIGNLFNKFTFRHLYIDQGYGYALYNLLRRLPNAPLIELFPNSNPAKSAGFRWMKELMSAGMYKQSADKDIEDERATFVDLGAEKVGDGRSVNIGERLGHKGSTTSCDLLVATMLSLFKFSESTFGGQIIVSSPGRVRGSMGWGGDPFRIFNVSDNIKVFSVN